MRHAMIAVLLAAPLAAQASEWSIDSSHSAAGFVVRHMMVSNVHGEFGKTSGTVTLDDADLTKSKVEATIDASTINTREPKRDEHLKSPDFFDVAKHPTATFTSKKATAGPGRTAKIVGDLTLRGVTKEVTLEVTDLTDVIKDPWGNFKVAATAKTRINRQDYGVSWSKSLDGGGVVVSDEVELTIDIEAGRKPEAPAAAK